MLDLLSAGGVTSEARYVSIEAFDGWYEGYDMFDVVHPQTIVAYGLNGKDLPVGNGAPVRLRVERQCGYKHLKFSSRLPLSLLWPILVEEQVEVILIIISTGMGEHNLTLKN